MCQVPKIKTKEYLDFFNLINNRLSLHNQFLTTNKIKILEILFENSEHLSVEEIVNLSIKTKEYKLSSTTVYRILSSFEAFDIIDSVLLDDSKKRYELTYLKKPHYHLYCQECSELIEFESLDIHDSFLTQLKNLNFQPTNFNVIINGVCNKCKIS